MIELEQHDMDALLGPLVDEFGVIPIPKKQEIIRQMSTQIDRITSERIRMSLIETADQMKELSGEVKNMSSLVSDKCDKIERELSAGKTGFNEEIKKIDSVLGMHKRAINEEIIKLKLVLSDNKNKILREVATISSNVEGSSKLVAGMMNVVNRFNESVVSFKEALGKIQKPEKTTPKEEKEEKDVMSGSVIKRLKAQKGEVSKEKKDDIRKGFESKSFKELVSDAKNLNIPIKPRMKKQAIIDQLVEYVTIIPTGD